MFQLTVLFLVLLTVHILLPTKHKMTSLVFAFVLAIIFIIQFSSVFLTGNIADYRFYENFNLNDVLSVADFFATEGIFLFLFLVLSTFLIHFLSAYFEQRVTKKIIPFSVLFAGLIVMSFQGGIIHNGYNTLQLKLAANTSLNQALSNLKINTEDYTYKSEVKATKGKNIIVLSLESLEKGYLSKKLKHLTPNLRHLAKNNTYIKMDQCSAGAWTSASMYIALTGVPAYFNLHGNSVFQSSHENKLTTLPFVLKQAGYDLQYFIGRKEYSGINDMLKTHGFTVKSEKDFKTKYEKVPWGIQDMDLFNEFKKALLAKKQSEKPFAFFLSTISTHFPNGVPDKRIDSLLPAQKSRIELMVSATDYYVRDLIDFLKKEKMLENTIFYIYPDHLLMGKNSRVVENFDERSLYLLTNALPKNIGVDPNKNINQIDIPKLILNGAEVENNAKFLTDFIPKKGRNNFLRKNAKSILQLNTAALTTLNLKKGFIISQSKEDNSFTIKNDDKHILLQEKIPAIGKSYRIILDDNLRPLKHSLINFFEANNKVPIAPHIDIFKKKENLFASMNGKMNISVTKKSKNAISFDVEDIELFQEANDIGKSSVILNSNGWNSKIGSSFLFKERREEISRGLTVIAFNTDSKLDWKTFDTYGSAIDAEDFMKTIKALEADKTSYIILAHDSAERLLKPFYDELKKLGFEKLSKLRDRQAYVMYNLDGQKVEQIDNKSISTQLFFPENIKNNKLYFTGKKISFKPNINRYIAHAGGEIDGIKYTNSIDALNYNYSKGFRMFELDISKTSDGVFVATHDWNHWKKEAGYKGETPVTLSEFKKHKTRRKYTTLDIDGINKWFTEHKDATLITDKVNEPKEFADKFVDKNRLIMELFSLKAVKEAKKNGIKPLLSEKAISEIKGDVVSYLLDHKITYIGLSRRAIPAKKKFLKKCAENNIKVYVYYVNFDKGKDEKYVYENEIGLVYGMYADKWLTEFNP